MRGTRLFVLGRQGAGKGTQCARLARVLGLVHVSTGELFRQAVASGGRLGEKVRFYLDAGELVPDDVVVEAVVGQLGAIEGRHVGYVLDGFPRSVQQAEMLLALMGEDVCELAIEIDVPTEVVLTRLSARRVCRSCGRTYAAATPDRERWACEACGGVVARRADDTEAAIRRRLAIYDGDTQPLLAWLDARGLLVSVDGQGSPATVHDRIVTVVRGNADALVESG